MMKELFGLILFLLSDRTSLPCFRSRLWIQAEAAYTFASEHIADIVLYTTLLQIQGFHLAKEQ